MDLHLMLEIDKKVVMKKGSKRPRRGCWYAGRRD